MRSGKDRIFARRGRFWSFGKWKYFDKEDKTFFFKSHGASGELREVKIFKPNGIEFMEL